MTIQPANRINNVAEYYFSQKLKEIARRKEQGQNILNLGIGNPDLPPASETIKTLVTEAQKPATHGYQPYVGIPELRQAFVQWYKKYFDVRLNPENEVLPLIGSKEGIMHISLAYLNPNDTVLIPNPAYPTYEAVAKLVEANIIKYNLKEENNWYPNFKEIEQHDLTKVKLMWVNYPNMPTGTPATSKLLEDLIAFGKKHNILICNDNPYSFILNDKQHSILSVEGAKDTALELNSLSKSHNMAGWRIGMVASSPEITNNILKVKSNMDSGMFRPLQVAAVKALNTDENWYKTINQTYEKRKKIVWQIYDTLQCTYKKNQVGMFVWAKIPTNYKNAIELTDKILDKAHVFITPASIFGSNGEQYVRISLCSKEETLQKAIKRIKENL